MLTYLDLFAALVVGFNIAFAIVAYDQKHYKIFAADIGIATLNAALFYLRHFM